MSVFSEHEPELLAAQAKDGSSRAYAELVVRFEGPLYNFLSVLTGDPAEAEDLTQEAFLRAWLKIRRYDPRRRFATWLFTLAKHVAISHRRRPRLLPLANEELEQRAEENQLEAMARREEGENIWKLASRVLSPDQHAALWLRYAEDAPISEIARILRRRETATRVLLCRARQALATHLVDDRKNSNPAPERVVCDGP